MTGDSTTIADRITMGAGPFAHCRRIPRTAAAASSLRGRSPIGGLRRYADSAGSTTRSQSPTRSGQLIEVGLAQVEFIAGGAVVHPNRRHGLGAITVKIAGEDDPCCLGHDSSLQRHACDVPLGQSARTFEYTAGCDGRVIPSVPSPTLPSGIDAVIGKLDQAALSGLHPRSKKRVERACRPWLERDDVMAGRSGKRPRA
jgi:hypothetical protein